MDMRTAANVGDGGLRAEATAVSAIMTRDVRCVSPDTTVEALETLLLERGLSGAPVVDGGGRLIGMVSKTDLVRRTHEAGDTEERHVPVEPGFHVEREPPTVREIMTPLCVCLPPYASVARAAALMAFEGVHRLPVVDANRVVGIVTPIDVLRWVGRAAAGTLADRSRAVR